MPRIRVEEHQIPVSIPGLPVCVRCLDIEPGVPGGDPNDPHPGPFAEDLCVSCCLAVAKRPGTTMKIVEQLAPHAIAVRPMRVHPRPGYDGPVDGPLRMAHGPRDYEGQGREAFWDQTPEERATALKAMVADANVNCAGRVDLAYLGTASENKAFAKGWLAELDRTRSKP